MKKLLLILFTFLINIHVLANDAQQNRVTVSNLRSVHNHPYGLDIISGVVKNITANPIKEVFVKFNLYDEQGNLIRNIVAHASNLEPGGQWILEAQSPGTFHSFKMMSVDTY